MFRYALPAILFLTLGFSATTMAQGQGPCAIGNSTNSQKLACAIPYLFGVNGLSGSGGALDPGADALGLAHQTHFESGFTSHLAALSSPVGGQLTLLPLTSPSSGIIFTFDKSLGVLVPSDASYGPILGERAETIGGHKLFLAFSYQYFNFDSVDGVDLGSLPAVFKHVDTPNPVNPSVTCSTTTTFNARVCAFVRDLFVTNNSLSLKTNQYTSFATYGLTRRIDVSVAIPIVNTRLKVGSTARVQDNSHCVDTSTPPKSCHKINPATTNCTGNCSSATFFSANSASGLGDVTLRVKGTVWSGERLGLGAGLDVRVPTGDELNFLGSGAPGVRPFAVVSYRARVSPHGSVGYEWNGNSVLAGDVTTGTKARLPNRFTYTAGADVLVIGNRLSAAFDIVGQRVFDAPRLHVQTFQDLGTCNTTPPPAYGPNGCLSPGAPNSFPDFTSTINSYNSTSASMGVKIRPLGKLLVTANVLIGMDDGGLRAKPVPLVGVSYTF